MLTADATPQARENSLKAGANSFLTKPVDARILLKKVALLTHPSRLDRKTPGNQKKRVGQASSQTFAASNWIDEKVLQELSSLGGGNAFISSLIDGFEQDGKKHIRAIHQHEDQDHPAYRESIHALKGSATELGALEMVKICLKAETLKPFDMATVKIKQLNQKISETFDMTVAELRRLVAAAKRPGPQQQD